MRTTTLKVKMLNEYILIKDCPIEETVSENGIILPKQNFQRLAIVCAVGKNSKFKVGEKIIKPIGKTTPVTIDNIEYECIKESLVFARL